MPTLPRRFARSARSARRAFFAACVALAVVFVTPQAVNATGGEIEALWKDYVVAKKRLQFDVTRLVSDKWPELGGVARLQRDQQFTMIEIRNLKFRYLLENDPQRLVMDDGLSTLANFEWTDEDTEALRASEPKFAVLERWVEFNDDLLSQHPNLPMAEKRVEELQREEHYRSIIERYEMRMADLETTLTLLAWRAKRSKPTESSGPTDQN
jgi:hypothetical protein